MTTILFAGGEDESMLKIGTVAVSTTTTYFRQTPLCARCALLPGDSIGGGSWIETPQLTITNDWFHTQMYNASTLGGEIGMGFKDSSGVLRLYLEVASSGGYLNLIKKNAAGIASTLATSSTPLPTSGAIYQVDGNINYSSTGGFALYINGSIFLTYTGDVTTDGDTSVASMLLARWGAIGNATAYSEIVIQDTDTRGIIGVNSLPMSALGNTDTFDVGAVANINETTLNDATMDASGTANQLQEYTFSAPISGNYVGRLVVSARASCGTTGPQHLEFACRVGGTDYLSGSIALSNALQCVQYVFDPNPNTSLPWLQTDVAAAGVNVGYKSIT